MIQKDIIIIIISITSLIASIITSIFVYLQTYKINRYEFMSKERTKKDILDLLSALNLIMEKSMYRPLLNISYDEEKKVLINFLLSDTWMITRQIIGDSEEYIEICYNFYFVIYDTGFIGAMAKKLGEDIDDIYFKHFNDVLKAKKKMKKNIGKYSKSPEFNNEWYKSLETEQGNLQKKQIEKIKMIKARGIIDPDLDILLGSLTGNFELVKEGIKNGGNVNVSTNILQKYD